MQPESPPGALWRGSWSSLIKRIALPLLILTFGTLTFLIFALVVRANPPAPPSVFPDIIRTSLGVGAGLAATITLVLAARRQWSNEDVASKAHHQKDEERAQRDEIANREQADRQAAAEDIRFDAAERRTTENFAQSVDQIGHEKAPVRLAGLYSLERLGQATESQRSTVLNVVCGYLRMPYAPPGSKPKEDQVEAFARWEQREQELNVRRVAEGIVRRHRLLSDTESFWLTDELDLTFAHLLAPNFSYCDLSGIRFGHTNLVGANLEGANLRGARLLNADIGAANLQGAYLVDASLGDTDFMNSDLRRANLANLDFFGCDLRHASLDSSNLTGCDLSAANLGSGDESAFLAGATWSDTTKWPPSTRDAVMQRSIKLSGDPRSGELFKVHENFRPTTTR